MICQAIVYQEITPAVALEKHPRGIHYFLTHVDDIRVDAVDFEQITA